MMTKTRTLAAASNTFLEQYNSDFQSRNGPMLYADTQNSGKKITTAILATAFAASMFCSIIATNRDLRAERQYQTASRQNRHSQKLLRAEEDIEKYSKASEVSAGGVLVTGAALLAELLL